MGWMEFVSSLVGRLISWPVLVAAIVFLFRKPLGELIGRVRSYEGLGQKIDFGEQLAVAEDSVEQAMSAIETDQTRVDQEASSPERGLAQEAEANPSFVIISAWERLNGALADLVGATAGNGPRRFARSPALMLPELERRNIVNSAYTRAVNDLRTLRNQVAHGQHNPTAGEAVAYAKSAEELLYAARILAHQQTLQQQRQSGGTAG